jgi:hypothetical protein
MKKIISLFQRNYEGDRLVRDEVVPGAEWVVSGEGVATVKYDGTACLVRAGRLYKRYDAKRGRTPPPDFEPAQDPDAVTGHWPGWVPVTDGPEDQWFRAAPLPSEDGTYEFIGPKINGNPYQMNEHRFIRHGSAVIVAPRTFQELKTWFQTHPIEGVVWHHPDGRMVKIKRKDFGLPWPIPADEVPND